MRRRLIRLGPRAPPKTTATTASTTTPYRCPPCPPYQLRLSNQGSGRACKVGKRILRQREVVDMVGHCDNIAKTENMQVRVTVLQCRHCPPPPHRPRLHPKLTPAPKPSDIRRLQSRPVLRQQQVVGSDARVCKVGQRSLRKHRKYRVRWMCS